MHSDLFIPSFLAFSVYWTDWCCSLPSPCCVCICSPPSLSLLLPFILVKQASVYSSYLFPCARPSQRQSQTPIILSKGAGHDVCAPLQAFLSICVSCTQVHKHVRRTRIPSDSRSEAFCIDACLPLSPVLFISPLISPFPTRYACLLCDPPLCVVYTLHLACSSLFSLPFHPFRCCERNLFHLIFLFLPPLLPHLISSQGPGKYGACEKWGLYSCCSPLSSSYMPLFCRKGEFVAHIWEEKSKERKKKHSGGVGTEYQGTERERASESDFFFFLKGCQAMSSKRREGTRGERKNAEVSNLFISPKKVTVVYQLTIHSGCCTSLQVPLPLVLSFTLLLLFPLP